MAPTGPGQRALRSVGLPRQALGLRMRRAAARHPAERVPSRPGQQRLRQQRAATPPPGDRSPRARRARALRRRPRALWLEHTRAADHAGTHAWRGAADPAQPPRHTPCCAPRPGPSATHGPPRPAAGGQPDRLRRAAAAPRRPCRTPQQPAPAAALLAAPRAHDAAARARRARMPPLPLPRVVRHLVAPARLHGGGALRRLVRRRAGRRRPRQARVQRGHARLPPRHGRRVPPSPALPARRAPHPTATPPSRQPAPLPPPPHHHYLSHPPPRTAGAAAITLACAPTLPPASRRWGEGRVLLALELLHAALLLTAAFATRRALAIAAIVGLGLPFAGVLVIPYTIVGQAAAKTSGAGHYMATMHLFLRLPELLVSLAAGPAR